MKGGFDFCFIYFCSVLEKKLKQVIEEKNKLSLDLERLLSHQEVRKTHLTSPFIVMIAHAFFQKMAPKSPQIFITFSDIY